MAKKRISALVLAALFLLYPCLFITAAAGSTREQALPMKHAAPYRVEKQAVPGGRANEFDITFELTKEQPDLPIVSYVLALDISEAEQQSGRLAVHRQAMEELLQNWQSPFIRIALVFLGDTTTTTGFVSYTEKADLITVLRKISPTQGVDLAQGIAQTGSLLESATQPGEILLFSGGMATYSPKISSVNVTAVCSEITTDWLYFPIHSVPYKQLGNGSSATAGLAGNRVAVPATILCNNGHVHKPPIRQYPTNHLEPAVAVAHEYAPMLQYVTLGGEVPPEVAQLAAGAAILTTMEQLTAQYQQWLPSSSNTPAVLEEIYGVLLLPDTSSIVATAGTVTYQAGILHWEVAETAQLTMRVILQVEHPDFVEATPIPLAEQGTLQFLDTAGTTQTVLYEQPTGEGYYNEIFLQAVEVDSDGNLLDPQGNMVSEEKEANKLTPSIPFPNTLGVNRWAAHRSITVSANSLPIPSGYVPQMGAPAVQEVQTNEIPERYRVYFYYLHKPERLEYTEIHKDRDSGVELWRQTLEALAGTTVASVSDQSDTLTEITGKQYRQVAQEGVPIAVDAPGMELVAYYTIVDTPSAEYQYSVYQVVNGVAQFQEASSITEELFLYEPDYRIFEQGAYYLLDYLEMGSKKYYNAATNPVFSLRLATGENKILLHYIPEQTIDPPNPTDGYDLDVQVYVDGELVETVEQTNMQPTQALGSYYPAKTGYRCSLVWNNTPLLPPYIFSWQVGANLLEVHYEAEPSVDPPNPTDRYDLDVQVYVDGELVETVGQTNMQPTQALGSYYPAKTGYRCSLVWNNTPLLPPYTFSWQVGTNLLEVHYEAEPSVDPPNPTDRYDLDVQVYVDGELVETVEQTNMQPTQALGFYYPAKTGYRCSLVWNNTPLLPPYIFSWQVGTNLLEVHYEAKPAAAQELLVQYYYDDAFYEEFIVAPVNDPQDLSAYYPAQMGHTLQKLVWNGISALPPYSWNWQVGQNTLQVYYQTTAQTEEMGFLSIYSYYNGVEYPVPATQSVQVGENLYWNSLWEQDYGYYAITAVHPILPQIMEEFNTLTVDYELLPHAQLPYTVRYYVNNVLSHTQEHTMPLGEMVLGVSLLEDNKIEGTIDSIVQSSSMGEPILPPAEEQWWVLPWQNQFEVYYHADTTPTPPTMWDYTVEYYYDGVLEHAKTYQGSVPAESPVVLQVPLDTTPEYLLENIVPALPYSLSGSGDVIQVYYRTLPTIPNTPQSSMVLYYDLEGQQIESLTSLEAGEVALWEHYKWFLYQGQRFGLQQITVIEQPSWQARIIQPVLEYLLLPGEILSIQEETQYHIYLRYQLVPESPASPPAPEPKRPPKEQAGSGTAGGTQRPDTVAAPVAKRALNSAKVGQATSVPIAKAPPTAGQTTSKTPQIALPKSGGGERHGFIYRNWLPKPLFVLSLHPIFFWNWYSKGWMWFFI